MFVMFILIIYLLSFISNCFFKIWKQSYKYMPVYFECRTILRVFWTVVTSFHSLHAVPINDIIPIKRPALMVYGRLVIEIRVVARKWSRRSSAIVVFLCFTVWRGAQEWEWSKAYGCCVMGAEKKSMSKKCGNLVTHNKRPGGSPRGDPT